MDSTRTKALLDKRDIKKIIKSDPFVHAGNYGDIEKILLDITTVNLKMVILN